jgi:hypothetical protein
MMPRAKKKNSARAILQRLLERVFNHYTRNIGGFLCAPPVEDALTRQSR